MSRSGDRTPPSGLADQQMSGQADVPRPPSALIRDRVLGPFLLGNLTSNIGTWMHNIAAAVVVFDFTGSAFQVGMLVFAQFTPALVLSPWAGAVVDRTDRKRVLVAALLLAGVMDAILATWMGMSGPAGLPGTWPLYATSVLIGVCSAFISPAIHSIIPSLVPPSDLDGTLGLTTVTFNLGRTLGPALAGVVLVTLGPAAAFAINAVSFFLFAMIVALVAVDRQVLNPDHRGSVREGLRFVRGDTVLVVLLISVASLGFAQDPVNTLAPPLARELGGGQALVGLLVTSFGIGSVMAVALGGRLRASMGRRAAAFGGLVALGAGMLVLAVAPIVPVAVFGLVVAGMGFLFAITSLMAGIYGRAPDRFRGRVLALWAVAFMGSRPIAGLLDGAIADLVSPRVATAVAAAFAMAAAALVRRRWTDAGAPPAEIARPG